MSEPDTGARIQTRTKNADQHPGLVVSKRKRRTQAEMKEAREREQKKKDELEMLRREKVRDLAALETRISQKDVQTTAGAHTVRPKPRAKVPKKNQVSGLLLNCSLYVS
jgi:hypothetical protein